MARAALSGDEQSDDDVGQQQVDQHPIVQSAPEHAAGLVLGDEDVEEHVLLGEGVQPEVETSDGQGEGLQRSETQRDGGVEEEVVIVAGVVEGPRIDAIAGCAPDEAPSERPSQRDKLTEIDGGTWRRSQQQSRARAHARKSSHTEFPLQEPAAPVRNDGDERRDDLPERMAVDRHLPGTVAAGVDEGGTESPEGGKEREDDEMVEEEEGKELVGDVALPARLGDVSGVLR